MTVATAHIYNISILVPAAHRDNANRFMCAIGKDVLPGQTFIAPSAAGKSGPATHYGCQGAETQEFIDLIQAAKTGTLPTGITWSDYDLTEGQARAACATMVIYVQNATEPDNYYEAVLAANGLQRVVQKIA